MNEESEQSNSVNQSVSNSVPQTTPFTPTEVPAKQAKSNNFLVTLLSILLLLAVSAAGFFAYQTQNLVGQLRELESASTPTPTTNNLQPTATPDPTADWKTYSGNKFVYSNSIYSEYSFKYPKYCSIKNESLDCATNTGNFQILVNAGGHGLGSITSLKQDEIQSYTSGNVKVSLWKSNEDNSLGGTYWFYETPKLEQDFIFGFEITSTSTELQLEIEDLMESILPTFMFIEPEVNSSPVACTMDAKICPDGSSVGRIAPDCEFAPCSN